MKCEIDLPSLSRLAPPAFDSGSYINGLDRAFGCRARFVGSSRPSALIKMRSDRVGDEPGSHRIHVPVALRALLMGIEPLWHDQVQMILGSGDGDIE